MEKIMKYFLLLLVFVLLGTNLYMWLMLNKSPSWYILRSGQALIPHSRDLAIEWCHLELEGRPCLGVCEVVYNN